MPLDAGVRLGPYEISGWLGRGGMGDVYRAIDTRLGRHVAVKVLHDHLVANPMRRSRFAREARAASRLSHPSICALHDVGEHDDHQYIVMEYVEGDTLAHRLMSGALPVAEVASIGADIADALNHAHRCGIVHRDLKPANIMLTRNGAKLLDFGLAHLDTTADGDLTAPSSCGTETLTEEGCIPGTVQYMSPEQLEGKRVDGRTDIFALGTVLHEMVTGRRAFEGPSKASVIAAILGRTAPVASRVRARTDDENVYASVLDDIIAKCLAKQPDERWQSASDLCQALRWAGRPLHTEAPTLWNVRRWRRSKLAWIGASVLVLAGLVAVIRMPLGQNAPKVARPMRWSMPAPEGSTFDPSPFALAVSPDGTHLAFIASSGSGSNALWVRPLDSLVARKLADGAAQPFWSADSHSIAFEGGGQVKKVDLATGLVQPLANTFAVSGSWSRSGVLLLALPRGEHRHDSDVLYSVSAAGGPLTAATTVDRGRAESRHAAPQFLPDGRRFLFLARSDDPERSGMLYAGSLDSPERVPLFLSRSRALYASGYLLFAQDQALLAQKFDPTTLRLEGEPVIVAEDLERNPAGPAFSVSDAGVLAYRPDRQTALVWFDRTGRSLGSITEPGHYDNPDVSPDEQRVAVSRHDRMTGQSDIWVIDLARRLSSKLTFGKVSAGVPLWSPDGSRVVYRSGSTLVVKVRNGSSTEEQLADHLSNFDVPLDWSPDGRMVLYSTLNSSNTDAWLLPVDGARKPIPLATTGSRWGMQARISPDGRWIAYASDETGRYDVYVRPYPSGDGKWLISQNGGSEPSWRRDGKELYYLAGNGSLMAVAVTTSPAFEAATPTRLFATQLSTLVNTSITRNQYVASADGQRFLLNQPAATPPSIVVVIDWLAALKPVDRPVQRGTNASW